MNRALSSAPSSLQRLLRLLRPALQEKKGVITRMIGALIFLSLSQSMFLLLMGPLFKATFETQANVGDLAVAALFPGHFADRFPSLSQLTLSRTALAAYLPLTILAVSAVKAWSTYAFQFHQSYLSLHLGLRYREQLFDTLIDRPYEVLQGKSPAAWMSLVMHDVQFLQMRLSDLFSGFIRDGSVVVSSLLALFFVHWPTALLVSLLSIPLMLRSGRTGRKIAGFAEKWQVELGRIAAAVLDLRQRFEFIRAQSGEARELKNFQALNQNYYQIVKKSIFIRSAFAPSLEFAGFCLFAGIVFLITQGVFGQNFGPGELLQFFAALGFLLRPIKGIGEQLSRYHETMGLLKSSLDAFDARAEDRFPPRLLSDPSANSFPSWTLQKMRIQYGEGFTLQTSDLTLRPGSAVVLIGPSGAGKSTLIKCFAGLYAPAIWEAEKSWQEVVSASNFVSQAPFLFTASMRDNLLYGIRGPMPSDESIWEALQFVGIDRELLEKGMSLDSTLDFLQSPLSGGQMQRLTVARALLRQKPLLLMDEITAAIDPVAEEILVQKLLDYCRTRAVSLIFVTHRLRQLALFDQVWFCEEGRIQAFPQGTQWQDVPRIESYLKSHLGDG